MTIDDHPRVAFTAMDPDENKQEAVEFLQTAVAYYAGLGVSVKRLLTNNGSAFRSREFPATCKALDVQHRFTRPYRPQTNGKAERFIQSAPREWALARQQALNPLCASAQTAAMAHRWKTCSGMSSWAAVKFTLAQGLIASSTLITIITLRRY